MKHISQNYPRLCGLIEHIFHKFVSISLKKCIYMKILKTKKTGILLGDCLCTWYSNDVSVAGRTCLTGLYTHIGHLLLSFAIEQSVTSPGSRQ